MKLKIANGIKIGDEIYLLSSAMSSTYDVSGNNIAEYYQPILSAGEGIEVTENNVINVKLGYITVDEP